MSTEACRRIPERCGGSTSLADIWKVGCIFMSGLKSSHVNLNPQFLHYFKGRSDLACLSHVICLKDMYRQLDVKWQTSRRNITNATCLICKQHMGNICLSLYGMDFFLQSSQVLQCLGGIGSLNKNFFRLYFHFKVWLHI